MDSAKKERLERADWTVGTTEEFLGLSSSETESIKNRVTGTIKRNGYEFFLITSEGAYQIIEAEVKRLNLTNDASGLFASAEVEQMPTMLAEGFVKRDTLMVTI